jgi:hypothetical protein
MSTSGTTPAVASSEYLRNGIVPQLLGALRRGAGVASLPTGGVRPGRWSVIWLDLVPIRPAREHTASAVGRLAAPESCAWPGASGDRDIMPSPGCAALRRPAASMALIGASTQIPDIRVVFGIAEHPADAVTFETLRHGRTEPHHRRRRRA